MDSLVVCPPKEPISHPEKGVPSDCLLQETPEEPLVCLSPVRAVSRVPSICKRNFREILSDVMARVPADDIAGHDNGPC